MQMASFNKLKIVKERQGRSAGTEEALAANNDEHPCEWDSFLHGVFRKNGTDEVVVRSVVGIVGSGAVGCTEIVGVVSQLKWSGALSAPASTLEEYEERKNKAIEKGMTSWEINKEIENLVKGVDAGPKQVRLAVEGVLDQLYCHCFPLNPSTNTSINNQERSGGAGSGTANAPQATGMQATPVATVAKTTRKL